MKAATAQDAMRPECDFSSAVRGRHHDACPRGANVILLEPDPADVFRNSDEVNAALRALARIARTHTKHIADT